MTLKGYIKKKDKFRKSEYHFAYKFRTDKMENGASPVVT